MWQLCLLSALIATSFCPAASAVCEDPRCGRYGPHAEANGKIDFASNVTRPGELPWMVAVFTKYISSQTGEVDPPIHHCNGALIHPGAVLVPNICLTTGVMTEGLTVRAGVWDIESQSETLSTQERTVRSVERPQHPSENLERAHMPAIFILSSPFELSENIGVVCVPRQDDQYDASSCIVSGWDKRGPAEDKGKLKRVSVPIIPRDQCKSRYEAVYPPDNFFSLELNKRSMCVGSNEHPDLCQWGSPLVCPLVEDPSRWVVVGLAVDSFGCRSHRSRYVSSQYADVRDVRDWIDDRVRANELNPLVYTMCSE